MAQLKGICASSSYNGFLNFVIGQNGLDLVMQLGFKSYSVIKDGNWLGPLILAASQEGVKQLLLFGYHGKLIKLAGGIFHTHHHLADGRIEILVSLAVQEELPFWIIKKLSTFKSLEDAF